MSKARADKPSAANIEGEILQLLAQTKEEILRRLAPFAERVPTRELDMYPDRLNAYIDEVEKLRADVAPVLETIGQKISSLASTGWQHDNRVVQFWLAFTHVVQTLRHNPEKGPAALYVSADNQLLGYSAANFLLAEMQPSPKLRHKLQKIDGRTAYNICAEPAAASHAIGHQHIGTNTLLLKGKKWRKEHWHYQRPPPNGDYIPLRRVPERRQEFLQRVAKLGKKDGRFDNSVLVTTADPCGSCTKVLIDIGVTQVISDAQSYFMPMGAKRRNEMLKSAERLDRNGVKHSHLHYQLNI